MASAPGTPTGKARATTSKRAIPKVAAASTAPAKLAPVKRRAAARPKLSTIRKSSAVAKLPRWVTIGASITGAVVAVGATLFATRAEWLPRAKKLGEWMEGTLQGQLESLNVVKSKAVDAASKLTASAPSFEHPDANRYSPAEHSTGQ